MKVTFKFEGLDELRQAAEGLGNAGTYAMYRATDEAGNKLFTQMKRAVATQTGIPYARTGKVMSWAQAMGSGKGSLMRRIDELHLKLPFYGSPRMMFEFNKDSPKVNRKHVQRLMRLMGIVALVPRPGTSKPARGTRFIPNQQQRRDPNPNLGSICFTTIVWVVSEPVDFNLALYSHDR
jgi:hypothetical protein